MQIEGVLMSNGAIGDVQLYESSDGSIQLEVRTGDDTVWLTRQQMAALFNRDVKTIGKHIANAQHEELEGLPTVANFATVQKEGTRSVERNIEHYNLDMVLSVGYRVKSKEGVKFRQWSNSILRQYVLKGAALNESRLEQIGQVVKILRRSDEQLVSGSADILSSYLPGLELLRDYDAGQIPAGSASEPGWEMTVDEARIVVASLREAFPQDDLLGNERGGGLQAIIGAVYQSFTGHDVYPSVEEKAANLLYLVIKDHPLSDGNKRSAAALFITFMQKNGILDDENGQPRINSNSLAALTLMVSMSDPKEKDILVALVMRLISK
jgi:prophage maintenance system killer protein